MPKRLLFLSFCLFLSALAVSNAGAQSITSGAIAGTVIDPSGGRGAECRRNADEYRHQRYAQYLDGLGGQLPLRIRAHRDLQRHGESPEFFRTSQLNKVTVASGQPTAADIKLQVATQTQDGSGDGSRHPRSSRRTPDVATNFSPSMVENLPNPGGDITYIVQTTPGAVMNTQAGYGNFVIDGLPSPMNNFMINGAKR